MAGPMKPVRSVVAVVNTKFLIVLRVTGGRVQGELLVEKNGTVEVYDDKRQAQARANALNATFNHPDCYIKFEYEVREQTLKKV